MESWKIKFVAILVLMAAYMHTTSGETACECETKETLKFVAIIRVVTATENITEATRVPDGYKVAIIKWIKACWGDVQVGSNARINVKDCTSVRNSQGVMYAPIDTLIENKYYLLKGFYRTLFNQKAFVLDHCTDILEVDQASTCACVEPLQNHLYTRVDITSLY